MTRPRYAFIKANWHAEIVDQALAGFHAHIPPKQVDAFRAPGAFEMPLMAKKLARSGDYRAVIAAAFVVDGGIYRHDFVAAAVVNGLMQVGLETDVPILLVSLTPHQYRDDDHHNKIYSDHFFIKGQEAANAVGLLEENEEKFG